MASRPKLVEQTFINELGESINVGDKVIIVTKRWQRVHVCRGSYLGVYQGIDWRVDVRCVVMCEEYTWHYRDKEGREYGWSYPLHGASLDHWTLVKKEPKPRRTCLQLNRIYKSADALVESLST